MTRTCTPASTGGCGNADGQATAGSYLVKLDVARAGPRARPSSFRGHNTGSGSAIAPMAMRSIGPLGDPYRDREPGCEYSSACARPARLHARRGDGRDFHSPRGRARSRLDGRRRERGHVEDEGTRGRHEHRPLGHRGLALGALPRPHGAGAARRARRPPRSAGRRSGNGLHDARPRISTTSRRSPSARSTTRRTVSAPTTVRSPTARTRTFLPAAPPRLTATPMTTSGCA